MKLKRLLGGLLALSLLPFTSNVLAANLQFLRGHVPAVVTSLASLGELPATNRLNLAISLPLRNELELSNLLNQIYDPHSPKYRHYLTVAEFTEQFGPSAQDYESVIGFAKANGLKVTATYANRGIVDVSGTASQIERALHTQLNVYRHPTENRNFYAPTIEPSLNLSVPVLHISGLDNYELPRPRIVTHRLANLSNASPNSGSGPSGTYKGNDFRAAYVPGVTLNGTGQSVGLLEFDGYSASDINYYETSAGLPNVPLDPVSVDGASTGPEGSGADLEVALDIEVAISMATNLTQLVVYIAPGGAPFEDILTKMVLNTQVKQFSCSWYISGGAAQSAADNIWMEMAAQGQSFFNASGDSDALAGLISFPGDSPYITQVGGTTLTTTGPGGAWSSETVWNWGNGIGSSGGISTQYPIPSWQTNISMAANQGSTTMRNTPDVAMTADNIYVRVDGADDDVGGTSCAAPLWAGFAALINQQAVASGRTPIGLINAAVDAIGTGSGYTSAFHDITTGNNTRSGSPTQFYAVTGYDLCTGWGTPAGQQLINDLANPEPLVIAPSSGFVSTGGHGGPFTTTSQTLTLTNYGTNTLTWTLSNTSAWLNVSSTGGTLIPGGPVDSVTVSLNSAASNLVVGVYNATLWFTNLYDGFGQSREFTLNVIAPPTINPEPTNEAVLGGATAVFNVEATGGLPLAYQWQLNGTNLSDGGNISGSLTTNLVIIDVSSNNVGTYTVVVTNLAAVTVSSNASLTLIASRPIFTLEPTNQTVYLGLTVHFAASVIGTTLYFYQWSFSGTNLAGATNSALTLTNVQFSQSGTYAITVTNQYGSTNSAATLDVIPPPPCVPPPAGIAAWWPAEDNADDIINGNDGTPVGNLTYTNGEVGQAFVFDGSTSDITVPASSSLNIGTGGGLTMECWINPSPANANYQGGPLIEWDSASTDGCEFWVYQDFSLYVNIKDTSGNAHILRTTSGIVTTNAWQHVALTYDESSGFALIYTNGVVAASSYFGGFTPQTTYPVNLGQRSGQPIGDGDTYAGAMDELSLYNRALSSNEIVAIFNAGSSGKCEMPTVPYIFVQPTNVTVTASQTATFTVIAGGTPPLNYQWMSDETNIVGATNAMLTLNDVQLSQAGIYYVVVSSSYGSVTSSNATLAVTPPPSCYPAPANIVAWWPAEGNANDIIGTNSGTAVGDLTYTNGEVGQAFVFDGSSSYITVPASSSLNIGTGGGMTIECWVNPSPANANNQGGPLIEWDSSNNDGAQFWVYQDFSLYVNIEDTSGNGHVMRTSANAVSVNTWQHVALTYNESSGVATLYVNGQAVDSANFGTFAPQTTYPVNLGRRTGFPLGAGDTYAGAMDELSLYNRTLSATEIAAIYNAGVSGKCPPQPTPPYIITPLTNEVVSVGRTAVFNVVAGGTIPLSYQWGSGGTNITGATNATLTLGNIQFNQAGTYSVTVTNQYGLTNSSATLTVTPPSSCYPAPTNIVAWWPAEGNTKDVIGTNNGTAVGNLTYTNGEVGQAFVFDGSSSYITVPASSSLNIGTGGGMTIECWVNPSPANANNQGGPLIEWDSSNNDGAQFWVYQDFSLYVNIEDTSGNGHVMRTSANAVSVNTWQHVALAYNESSGVATFYVNGQAVDSANFGTFAPQTTYPVNLGRRTGFPLGAGDTYAGAMDELSLYNRTLSATEIAAIYNAGSSGKCPPTLPYIIQQPTNVLARIGGTASFSVVAGGTAPLSYQWYMNSTNQIIGATNISLTITNVQLTNAGTYEVLVTNFYGYALSTNALLTMAMAPTIASGPTNLIVSAASSAVFSVTASGTPPLNFQWNFNNTNVISGATNSSLTLTNVQYSNGGLYSVIVTNLYGSTTSSNALLIVTVDHFAWSNILSPKFAGAPFTVEIVAQNATNGVFTNYTGIVFISTTNGVAVSPAASGNLIQGVWAGTVAVSRTATNLVLSASDGSGHIGLANPISVVSLPPITASPSAGTLYLSWPTNPAGFQMESTTNLSSGIWVPITMHPLQFGDQYVEPITPTGTNTSVFYRLYFNGQ